MLVVSDLSFALPNGNVLFSHISFSCTAGVTALVGRNGIGKSTLLECINPQQNGVSITGTYQLLQQSASDEVNNHQRVIDALHLGSYYDALERIEVGTPRDSDIDFLEHHWDVRERAQTWLDQAGLSVRLEQTMHQLSGGQRTKLHLIGLLQQSPDLLLLDEPSNHLDQPSTQWLIDQLAKTKSTVLLVSHDKTLLNSVDRFLVLDETGVHPYHLAFTDLREALKKQRQDTLNAVQHAKAQLKKEQREQHDREQKAQRRQRHGEALRASGSQSKMLLDKKKNKAQIQSGAQTKRADQRSEALKQVVSQYQDQQTQVSALNLQLSQPNTTQRRLLDLIQVVLPLGDKTPLTVSLDRGERLRVNGPNGSGKSTLLQCIQGIQTLTSGQLNSRCDALYLDQHLSLLDQSDSPLAFLQERVPNIDYSTTRTLLASIGLRGEHALQPCSMLSGGERMKVALLLISQLPSNGLLILDETDNHLDLDSQDQLAITLDRYQGAVIFVTHQDDWLRTDKVITLQCPTP
ncbi:hypothetical protein DN730_14460 [Marinomonas piezotolerans]|uniref:ABC transporter domain-containing protein n=1 Tax=Marinomonas piezotolerans TaxID=2213058 RepID=A0A370U704_9GAMM|nr:ATP-binding cassette domain-containing protein [Marinomonas piezotolerans]RDL43533.1 hypothetical protein DN730_14460 [Marinomonas piezotolerans]